MPRFLSNPDAYHGEKCTSNDMNNQAGVVPQNMAAIKTTLLLQEATNDIMPSTLAYSDDFEGSVVLQETAMMMVENGTRIAFTEPLERSHSQSSDQTGKMLFGDFGGRQKAADTAKAAASNAANNNVKSAATAEVAAIQAKVEAAFKEKLGLVYAMGGGVGENLNPLKDCYDSVLNAIEVIKRVLLNIADIANPDKSNTCVNNFNQLRGHVSDVREFLSSFRVNLTDVVTTGASIATNAVNGIVNVGKTAISETEGALTMDAASDTAKTWMLFGDATNKFDGVEKENYKDDAGTKNDSPSASFGTQLCRYVSPL
jgi:hypothetical protein